MCLSYDCCFGMMGFFLSFSFFYFCIIFDSLLVSFFFLSFFLSGYLSLFLSILFNWFLLHLLFSIFCCHFSTVLIFLLIFSFFLYIFLFFFLSFLQMFFLFHTILYFFLFNVFSSDWHFSHPNFSPSFPSYVLHIARDWLLVKSHTVADIS